MVRNWSSLIFNFKYTSDEIDFKIEFRKKLYKRIQFNYIYRKVNLINNWYLIKKKLFYNYKILSLTDDLSPLYTAATRVDNTHFLSRNPLILYYLRELIFSFKSYTLTSSVLFFNKNFFTNKIKNLLKSKKKNYTLKINDYIHQITTLLTNYRHFNKFFTKQFYSFFKFSLCNLYLNFKLSNKHLKTVKKLNWLKLDKIAYNYIYLSQIFLIKIKLINLNKVTKFLKILYNL